MAKDYSGLSKMVNQSHSMLCAAYNKVYKQGMADVLEILDKLIESGEEE